MMPAIVAALGRAQKLEAMRRGFTSKTEPGSGVYTSLLVVALILMLVVVALLVLNRMQQGRQAREKGSARSLFREVLRKLSLASKDRALLRRVAEDLKLENPSVMLLTPGLFAETVYAYASAKTGKAAGDLQRLALICKRVFKQDLPPPSQADAEPPSVDTHLPA